MRSDNLLFINMWYRQIKQNTKYKVKEKSMTTNKKLHQFNYSATIRATTICN